MYDCLKAGSRHSSSLEQTRGTVAYIKDMKTMPWCKFPPYNQIYKMFDCRTNLHQKTLMDGQSLRLCYDHFDIDSVGEGRWSDKFYENMNKMIFFKAFKQKV